MQTGPGLVRSLMLCAALTLAPALAAAQRLQVTVASELSAADVQRLLGRRASGSPAADAVLADRLGKTPRDDALWPVLAFLRGELLLQLKRPEPAAEAYRMLVEQAASNAHQDTWGDNALVAFALYRWLKLQDGLRSSDRATFERLAGYADALLQTRLVRSVFDPRDILATLPRLEEQIYRALADEALRLGLRRRAGEYFVAFVSRATSTDFVFEQEPLYRVALDEKLITADGLALLHAKRLITLGRRAQALPHLEAAMASERAQTRMEALYLKAHADSKIQRAERAELYEKVNRYATDDNLAQAALLQKGLLYAPRDPEFGAVLGRVVNDHPGGSSTDEALYWLAYGARVSGDLDRAIIWLGLMREFQPRSGRLPGLMVQSALALLWRDRPADREQAARLLEDVLSQHPASDEGPRALFWLGRIAERAGREAEAHRHFDAAAKADAYGYYGLRARMHRVDGAAASGQSTIGNASLRSEIHAAHAPRPAAAADAGTAASVYARRVHGALDSGIYQAALLGEQTLRGIDASRRVQQLDFEALDGYGLLAPIAVSMALRQDALAAADARSATPADRLALARRIGEAAGDHPAALKLLQPHLLRPPARRAAVMGEPGYLGAAYPVVFEKLVADGARRWNAPASLLYAVMRQESLFYTAALSPANALGLFQFTPGTFKERNAEWNLGASTDAQRVAFLMNEQTAVELGARWFGELKLPGFGGKPLWAMLAHHSGDTRVSQWQKVWRQRGWIDDVETMVETFRMNELMPDRRQRDADEDWGRESRGFARRALTDYALMDALKLYPQATP